jgi:hypothetical protein
VITGSGELTGCSGDLDPGDPVLVECDQMTIKYFDNIGLQFDPGEDQSGSLKIHVKQAAEQSDCSASSIDIPGGTPAVIIHSIECNPDTLVSYTFAVKVCVAQWNEEADYTQCAGSAQHEGPGGADDPDFDNVHGAADLCPTEFTPPEEDVNHDGCPDLI